MDFSRNSLQVDCMEEIAVSQLTSAGGAYVLTALCQDVCDLGAATPKIIEEAIMPINHREIVADIREHVQKSGAGFGEWWVGTARDSHGAFFESHRVAELNDGFIYREVYTPTGAQEARDYLANECGLHLDLEDVPEPGRGKRCQGETVSGGGTVSGTGGNGVNRGNGVRYRFHSPASLCPDHARQRVA